MNKQLEFKNVSLTYQTKSDEIKAIENLSFNCHESEFLSIIGPSGCGKTTFINLLMRFYDVDKGTISIGEERETVASAMEKEYEFWMKERVTSIGLNKYGHNADDEWLVGFCNGICQRLNISPDAYEDRVAQGGHFLAIAESGWDFTPRFHDGDNYYACEYYAPVDLNSILYGVERTIAEFSKVIGDKEKEKTYLKKAENRKALMDKYMKGIDGFYYDYNYKNDSLSSVISAASFTPYTFGVSADLVALNALTDKLLCEYGIPATEKLSRECLDQWAYPSVWPPLTFFAVKAMQNLGSDKLKTVAERYVNTVRETFDNTRTLWEKYDAEKGGVAYGHEYRTVEMFGWTAGVYSYLVKNCI